MGVSDPRAVRPRIHVRLERVIVDGFRAMTPDEVESLRETLGRELARAIETRHGAQLTQGSAIAALAPVSVAFSSSATPSVIGEAAGKALGKAVGAHVLRTTERSARA